MSSRNWMYHFTLNKTYRYPIGSRLFRKAYCTTTFLGFGRVFLPKACLYSGPSTSKVRTSFLKIRVLLSFFQVPSTTSSYPLTKQQWEIFRFLWVRGTLAEPGMPKPGRINSVQVVLILNCESFSDNFQSALYFCLGGSGPFAGPAGKDCCTTEQQWQQQIIIFPDSLKSYSENIS